MLTCFMQSGPGDVCKGHFRVLERFSIECRKTKTKVITPTNHKKRKQLNEPIRTRSKCM